MRTFSRLAIASLVSACGGAAEVLETGSSDFNESAANPFTDAPTTAGKADTQYFNPDGIEVEVDIEGDVEAPDYKKADAPAVIGQYALTYLRQNKEIYLESLAEQATSDDRVEWLVDGTWLSAREAKALEGSKLTHFRIRGINAVLLHEASNGVKEGTVFTAPVPIKPHSIMADAGAGCATEDGHMPLDQSIYWYLWNPDKSGCTARTQDLKITVSKMLPSKVTYPEYDLLVADGKVTMVVLFGQIGDGAITDADIGVRAFNQMARWLKDGKFTEATSAPVGKRFSKVVGGVTVEVDLYSPRDFSGLSDFAHIGNFRKALTEHEIVAYDGHSMLGASDFWSEQVTYPDFYQVFLYGGCLGYEYYIAPILAGKGGWDKVDIMSSVIEVTANANEYAGPFLAKLVQALENGYKVSWKDILGAVRTRVGDSTFGMSGVRDNCFAPGGSLCGGSQPVEGAKTYESTPGVAIPDASAKGAKDTLAVEDDIVIGSVSLHLQIDHSYVGDLTITLEHGGSKVTVWDAEGGEARGIDQRFELKGFAGESSKGDWTLKVVDGAAQDDGSITAWSLTIAP